MKNEKPKFEIIRMPPENTNSVLLSLGKDCVIFDAWGRAEDWEKLISDRGLNLRAIYATHGHTDHIAAAPTLAEKYGVPWYMNFGDTGIIFWGNSLLRYFGLPPIEPNYKKPINLAAGMVEVLPGVEMQVIETPGHSAGGLSFYFKEGGVLLTGDNLSLKGFGRYDVPTANGKQLAQSISEIYNMNLPDDTQVVYGHGENSTIKMLKEQNPYFKNNPDLH